MYELKQLKKLANEYLEFYISVQKNRTKGWEKNLVKRNISLLTEIIRIINSNKHRNKISEFLRATRSTTSSDITNQDDNEIVRNFSIVMKQGDSFSLLLRIIKCSPKISYFNDLTWFKHGYIAYVTLNLESHKLICV